mmetsp:Transcript_55827/g.158536  ORF Transcript_55827/g.158536 Transcript_55827/m.158536 type:complete len:200 (+) Transcript_55827:3-602(+)
MALVIDRVRRLLARRETLLMGDAHSGNFFARRAPAGDAPPEVRWIDFQHWGSGAAALELSYFLMGTADAAPGRDDELLRGYHAELARCGADVNFDELRADIAAAILSLAGGALFHYPIHSWAGGSGIVHCNVDLQSLTPASAVSRFKESEKQYRMIYRMIQRVLLILEDESNPLTRELRARHAEVRRAGPPAGGPRSRL